MALEWQELKISLALNHNGEVLFSFEFVRKYSQSSKRGCLTNYWSRVVQNSRAEISASFNLGTCQDEAVNEEIYVKNMYLLGQIQ